MGHYEFYLGPHDNSYFKVWRLKHVQSISMNFSKKSVPFGVPGLPAESAMVFDVEGPVRKITIEGIRYEQQEEVSNWDFIYTQDNLVEGEIKLGDWTISNPHYQGITWATAQLQVNYPYIFISRYVEDSSLNQVGVDSLPNKADLISDLNADENTYIQEEICVSVTRLSFKFDPKSIGLMTYSIDLLERMMW